MSISIYSNVKVWIDIFLIFCAFLSNYIIFLYAFISTGNLQIVLHRGKFCWQRKPISSAESCEQKECYRAWRCDIKLKVFMYIQFDGGTIYRNLEGEIQNTYFSGCHDHLYFSDIHCNDNILIISPPPLFGLESDVPVCPVSIYLGILSLFISATYFDYSYIKLHSTLNNATKKVPSITILIFS